MLDRNKDEMKEELRLLDGILPESVDRRDFMVGAAASLTGLAGCLGGGGGGDGTPTPRVKTVVKERERTVVKEVTQTEQIINKNTIYRAAWKAEPDYSIGHAAARKGYWNEAGISPPQAKAGNGSTDTVKRIASDSHVTQFGNAFFTAFTSALNQGLDPVMIGSYRTLAMWSLTYEWDKFDSPTDLAGKKILTQGSSGSKTFSIYADAAGVPMGDIDNEFGKEAFVTQALGSDNTADAVWGPAAEVDKRRENSDVELGINPLYNLSPLMGYGLYANQSWMEESSDNREYTVRMLEGLSRAAKWVFMNPDETVEMMDRVNPQLQALNKETKLNALRIGLVATNLAEHIRDRGFGALDEEAAVNTVNKYAEVLEHDVPPAEEVIDLELNQEAELAPFTDDEWDQVTEFGQPWARMFLEGDQQPWKSGVQTKG